MAALTQVDGSQKFVLKCDCGWFEKSAGFDTESLQDYGQGVKTPLSEVMEWLLGRWRSHLTSKRHAEPLPLEREADNIYEKLRVSAVLSSSSTASGSLVAFVAGGGDMEAAPRPCGSVRVAIEED